MELDLCSSCLFLEKFTLVEEARIIMPSIIGRCHRYPSSSDLRCRVLDDWCGDYKHLTKKENLK